MTSLGQAERSGFVRWIRMDRSVIMSMLCVRRQFGIEARTLKTVVCESVRIPTLLSRIVQLTRMIEWIIICEKNETVFLANNKDS